LERVSEGVEQRLLAQGWGILETKLSDPSHAGTLSLPVKDGFVATMRVLEWLDEGESGQFAISPVGVVGLDYEPARKLTMALTGLASSGVVMKEPTLVVTLSDDCGIAEAADSLVRFAAEQTASLASIADVDTLIEMLHRHRAVADSEAHAVLDGDDPIVPPPNAPQLQDPNLELITALLAGAGRFDEARRFLSAHNLPGWQKSAEPQFRRFVRQLTRWVDHNGRLVLPTTPARWPPELPPPLGKTEPPANFLQALAEHWPKAKASNEAVETVRAASHGKTRDELRTLLRDELRRRDVSMEPVSLELKVDALLTEREPFGKARMALRGLSALRDLGRSRPGAPIHAIFTDEPRERPGERPDPAWIQTPERAAYPILLVGPERVAVELDPQAGAWLEELMHAAESRPVQMRFVDVWLSPDGEQPSSVSRLSVHIGSRRVGQLDADATERFRPAIEAAAERDEDARATAHLTRIPGGVPYVLVLPLPGQD